MSSGSKRSIWLTLKATRCCGWRRLLRPDVRVQELQRLVPRVLRRLGVVAASGRIGERMLGVVGACLVLRLHQLDRFGGRARDFSLVEVDRQGEVALLGELVCLVLDPVVEPPVFLEDEQRSSRLAPWPRQVSLRRLSSNLEFGRG